MKKNNEKNHEESFDEAEYYEGNRSEIGGVEIEKKNSKDSSVEKSDRAQSEKLEQISKKSRK